MSDSKNVLLSNEAFKILNDKADSLKLSDFTKKIDTAKQKLFSTDNKQEIAKQTKTLNNNQTSCNVEVKKQCMTILALIKN